LFKNQEKAIRDNQGQVFRPKEFENQFVVFVINPYSNGGLRPNERGAIKPDPPDDFKFEVIRGFFNDKDIEFFIKSLFDEASG
jgi:hypothetical protein